MTEFFDRIWGETSSEEREQLVRDARKEWDSATAYRCRYDNCTWFYDEQRQTVIGGHGRAGCPCEDESETDEHAMLFRKVA